MAAAILCLIALLAAGCGGERSFDAEELIDELNEHGASLVLEGPLPNEQEGVEVYAVSVGAATSGDHGGGSLVLAEDADAAVAEHERCESAISFFCFRAANAVLIVEDGSRPEEIERVGAAIRALASG